MTIPPIQTSIAPAILRPVPEIEEKVPPLKTLSEPIPLEQAPTPTLQAEEIRPPHLQQLLEQIQRLVDNPQKLRTQLNETLQQQPCFQLEEYQTRIVQLRQMLEQIDKIPAAEPLCYVIKQHLIHAEQAAGTLYRNSQNPVHDSLWPLYERILKLPTLTPDLFGAAVATLEEKLPQALKSDPLTQQLTHLLPKLQPPTHYLVNEEAPFTAPLETLEEIKQKSLHLLHRLKQAPQGYLKNLIAPLESIFESYRSFLEKFHKASSEKKELLRIPKAQLSGVGLGFFSLDPKVARALLSRNEEGKLCKTNETGTHAVCYQAGVFYKPNSEGSFYIRPEMEFALYAFYQWFGRQGAAPTGLAKIRHLFFEGQTEPYGRILQAGYGVGDLSLQELLGFAQVLPLLENSLGKQRAQEAFRWLMQEDWQQTFLKEHPHLAALSHLTLEESRKDLETHVDTLLEAFTTFFSQQPERKRCLEFGPTCSPASTKQDFRAHLHKNSTQLLIGTLALLQRYPDLATASCKTRLRQVSFTELTDLQLRIRTLKKQFPNQTVERLLQELPQLMNRFDPADFSTHFVVSLLTNPADHKTDNLMVTLNRNQQGGVESLSLIGIDNDQIFAPEEAVRTILYLLKPMNTPLDSSVTQKLLEGTPEGLVFDWLVALEEQNRCYERWQKQGILKEQDLVEEGTVALRTSLELETQQIPTLYLKAKHLVQILQKNPSTTHWELFKALQPKLAQAYQRALSLSDHPEEAYKEVPRSFPKTIKLTTQTPTPQFLGNQESPTQTVREAASHFLKSLEFPTLPLKLQVSLLGKALQTFPSLEQITIPGNPNDPGSRREFFLMAVKQGHHALVARLLIEEKLSHQNQKEEGKETPTLLECKNNDEQTALLIASFRQDLEMLRLLIQHGADPQACSADGRNALSLCLTRFAGAPAQTAATIRLLGDHTSVLFNAAAGPRGHAPLHHLVDQVPAAPEEAEPLIAYLISKGASADLADTQGKTVLDRAIEQNQERLVIQLIQLGAGRTLNLKAAQNYFRTRAHLQETHLQLQRQSLLYRWHLALETLRTTSTPSETTLKGAKLDEVTLEGAQLGKITLTTTLTKQLLDKEENISPQIAYGRRNVNKITLPDGQELFFKQYPEMAGVEYAIDTLFELLIGHGTSFTDLARLTPTHGKSYPVLISQGIKGENLHDILLDPSKSEQLKKLDPLAFSELFMASLLVNFEDAKPDNFILEPLSQESYRLVAIDNDHAFVPPLMKENGKTVQVKNILYCLDQMNEPLHPHARERFLSFTPERLLRLWLTRLVAQNESYTNLFSKTERKALFKKSKQSEGIVIPIPFRPKAIADIYQKFQYLQEALRETPLLTGMQLLRLVIPQLGVRYEEAFHGHQTALERFFSLTSTQYSIAMAGRYQTLVNSRQMLKSMAIAEKTAWEEISEQGPSQALGELDQLQQEIQADAWQFAKVRNALQEGDTTSFLQLGLDASKEKVIKGISGAFEGIDFESMQSKGAPNLEKQQTVLSAILTGNYRTLHLSGCAVFGQTALKKLLINSPQLHTLELRNCPKINQEILTTLSEANYLTHLRLSDLPQLTQISLPHPTLRRLELLGCQQVEQLTISHTLKSLSIEACWKLKTLEAKLYKRSLLRGAQLIKQAPPDFVLENLELKACPQLQPWWEMFSGWLKVSINNCIRLQKSPPNPTTPDNFSLLIRALLNHPEVEDMLRSLGIYVKDDELGQLLNLLKEYESNPSAGLDLREHKWITESGLTLLGQFCPRLTLVNLSGCTHITESGLSTLRQSFPGLNIVNLWDRYFGEVGAVPPLPPNIAEILGSPCPVWPGKTVGETHKLVLVPGTVNGPPLTLDLLGELIRIPRQGNATKYRYYDSEVKKEHGKSSYRAHWILMTKDVIPGSRDKSYAEQKAMVTGLVGGYQVPTLLEAAVCILMEHVETGRRLFSDDPWTYTRCQEKVKDYQTVAGGLRRTASASSSATTTPAMLALRASGSSKVLGSWLLGRQVFFLSGISCKGGSPFEEPF